MELKGELYIYIYIQFKFVLSCSTARKLNASTISTTP